MEPSTVLKLSRKEFLLFFQGLSRDKGNLIDQTREWVSLHNIHKDGVSSSSDHGGSQRKELAFQGQML
jgi:hypothetical protein